MLSAIRDYLQQRGEASLADISRHLDADADAVRGMLEQWERKGRVERRKVKAECG
ncbi:MAG: FeoC-like transcriptional regulator, partial [Candidatus Thiodiazotropha sp.]